MTNLENYRSGFILSNGSLRKGPTLKKLLLDIVHLSSINSSTASFGNLSLMVILFKSMFSLVDYKGKMSNLR